MECVCGLLCPSYWSSLVMLKMNKAIRRFSLLDSIVYLFARRIEQRMGRDKIRFRGRSRKVGGSTDHARGAGLRLGMAPRCLLRSLRARFHSSFQRIRSRSKIFRRFCMSRSRIWRASHLSSPASRPSTTTLMIFRLTPLTSAAKSNERLVSQKLCNTLLILDAL